MAFLETGAFVGLIAPGETTIIVGGVIAGQGEVELIPLIGLIWVCAVLGDTTSFFIGSRMGRDFMLRHGPRFKITEERLNQVEGYFERHGGKTILIGRFVGLIRAMAPFVIGSSGSPTAASCPSASSAAASGPRCSASSATSSTARSTRWRASRARPPSGFGIVSSWSPAPCSLPPLGPAG